MMENQVSLSSIQRAVWDGKLPLQITLASSESRTYDQTDPYLVTIPPRQALDYHHVFEANIY